jgi:hypothetical protein
MKIKLKRHTEDIKKLVLIALLFIIGGIMRLTLAQTTEDVSFSYDIYTTEPRTEPYYSVVILQSDVRNLNNCNDCRYY